MLVEIIKDIIFFVLGAFGAKWFESWKKNRYKKLWNKRKNLLLHYSRDWLINYYKRNNKKSDLYKIQIGETDKNDMIPYLTKKEWYEIGNKKVHINIYDEHCTIKRDRKLIHKRKLMGQNIWDDNILYFLNVKNGNNIITIDLGECTYFQYLSTCGKLEDELYKCLCHKNKKAKIRDKYANSLNKLESATINAQVFGVSVAVVIKHEKKFKILIQERSDRTGVAGGTCAVVPTFVCNPNHIKDVKLDIILHYFLLEFYEELYDREELVKNSSHLKPDWFYEEEPICSLLKLQKNGKFKFEILGFGFDGNTGEFSLSALAIIEDEKFVETELKRMKTNWELKGLNLVNLDPTVLKEILTSEMTYVTSAFCISRLYHRFYQRTEERDGS